MRTYLTSQQAFYVNKTLGSDSNDGSAGAPWRTPQHAYDWIRDNLDFGGQTVTVNVGPGSHDPLTAAGMCVGLRRRNSLLFRGDISNPFTTGLFTISGLENALTVMDYAVLSIEGFHTTSVGNGFMGRGVIAYNGGCVNLGTWGHHVCTKAHMLAGGGGTINCYGTQKISSGSEIFALSEDDGHLYVGESVEIVANAAFTTAFAVADRGGLTDFAYTQFSYAGGSTVTGIKYNANTLGKVVGSFTNGIPGDSPGITATGGIYI